MNDVDVERRLQNWARWKLTRGGGTLGYAGVALDYSAGARDRNGFRVAVIPTNDVEAGETDDAVDRLHPGGLRLAVYEHYIAPGTVAEKAARLAIGQSTLYARLKQARLQLAEHFEVQAERARAERQRVEQLTNGRSADNQSS